MISLASGNSIEQSPSVRAPVTRDSSSSGRFSQSFLRPLRKLVSGHRSRLIDSGFNLDMAYITPRIIAMSFPATGMEAAYRNPRSQVLSFLNQYHKDRYFVFNFCAETRCHYEASEFDGRVAMIPVLDHEAPSLYQISDFCKQATNWLSQHDDNVIVTHCLGGKGRTGVMVASYLLASKICANAPEALELFSQMRSGNSAGDGGVTIPSQVRFVKLFEEHLILSKYSLPLCLTSLSVAKHAWVLERVDIGPMKGFVESIKIRRRNDSDYTEIALPLLTQQEMKARSFISLMTPARLASASSPAASAAQVYEITCETRFESTEDAHVCIKVRRGLKTVPVKMWLCTEMSQTMMNHRSLSDGSSTVIFNSEDLDSPENADMSLRGKLGDDDSRRFFVKIHIKLI